MRNFTKAALLSTALLGAGSATFAQDASMTLADNAMAASNFTTLVAAVQAAGLAETLMGEGPYTVFAPSNDAFAVADQAMIAELMLPENQEQLATLLKAHIVPGLYMAADFEKAIGAGQATDAADVNLMVTDGVASVDTLAGANADIFVGLNGDQFNVSGDMNNMVQARIVQADVMSSNGVIHVIDHVLMPVAN